jgi:hypothetical protein
MLSLLLLPIAIIHVNNYVTIIIVFCLQSLLIFIYWPLKFMLVGISYKLAFTDTQIPSFQDKTLDDQKTKTFPVVFNFKRDSTSSIYKY